MGLHGRFGHVSPSGLARPGPLPLLSFYFFPHLSTWKHTWAGPTLHSRMAQLIPATFKCLKI
jgi:hypothetical protein